MAAGGIRCEVPGAEHPTIQSAVDDAAVGTILVAAGTYRERLVIPRTLVLRGAGPGECVLEGGGEGVVVKITGGAAPTLEGFTITGGDGTAEGGEGGGIRIEGATATIRNNVIAGNVASRAVDVFGWGGGIYVKSSTAPVRIEGNTIQNNVAFLVPMDSTVVEGQGGGAGGGIAIAAEASADIVGNTVRSNLAFTRGDKTSFPFSGLTLGGGGIFSRGDVTNIEGNTIEDNCVGLAGNLGHGGGIDISGREATISDNRIARNTGLISGPLGQGGGINVTGRFQKITITGNRIEGNTGMSHGSSEAPNPFISAGGGGIHVFGRASMPDNVVTVQNNHILDNILAHTLEGTGGPGSVIGGGGGGSYIVRCNTVVFTDNEVRGNVAVMSLFLGGVGAYGGAQGGGCVFQAVQSATVSRNQVCDNRTAGKVVNVGAIASNDGGGMSIWRSPHAVVTDNVVTGNLAAGSVTFFGNNPYASYYARGGGIYASDVQEANFDGEPNFDDSVVLRGNRVLDNATVESLTAVGPGSLPGVVQGSGILVGNIAAAEIVDNELRGNVAVRGQALNATVEEAAMATLNLGTATVEGNLDGGNGRG